MINNDIIYLQEIYLLEDMDSFFVGFPLSNIGNWNIYITFDDTGGSPSIYLFNENMITETVTQSPYLDFLRFAIQRNDSQPNRPKTKTSIQNKIINPEQKRLLANGKNIESVLTENQVLGIGTDTDERFLGKITSLTPQGIYLKEFDFNTCQLVKENLTFAFSEIAHIELFSERTKLITQYLK